MLSGKLLLNLMLVLAIKRNRHLFKVGFLIHLFKKNLL